MPQETPEEFFLRNMDAAIDFVSTSAQEAGKTAGAYAKKFDQWALDNPTQAAILGASVGLATSVVFNKAFAIKGGLALLGDAYGTIKGGAMGYGYAKVRKTVADNSDALYEAAGNVFNDLSATAEDIGKTARRAGNTVSNEIDAFLRKNFG